MKLITGSISVILAVVLSACGGGGDSSTGSPAPSPSQAYELQPQSMVLDKSSITIVAVDDTSVVLKGDTKDIVPGKILISSEGDGFLRKVASVTKTADGVKVSTEQASLTEAFSKLDVKLDKLFGPEDIGRTIPTDDPGLTLFFRKSATEPGLATGAEIAGPELVIQYKDYGGSVNSGMELSGEASFKANIKWDMSLRRASDTTSTLTYRFVMNPSYRHEITAKTKYGGAVSMTKSKDIRLGRFVIPDTPIVVIPTLVLEANAKGSAAGAFGATYRASVSGGAWIERDVTGKMTYGHTYVPLQTGTFDLAESTLAVAATPVSAKIELRIYNIGGPNGGLEAVGELTGTYEQNAATMEEGIRAKVAAKINANIGAGGKIPLPQLFGAIEGGFSIFNIPFELAGAELANEFFRFPGKGDITVRDNGSAADDIFEVALDGLVLGKTSKGGSGQFRLSSLRPGTRTLTIKTIEDDEPPGTYEITLSNGLTFVDGSTIRSGGLSLGDSRSFDILVPSK